jgi:hypothetical protein
VSVALIVLPSAAICILLQAINMSCFVLIALVTTLFSTGLVEVVDNAGSIAISLVELISKFQLVPSYRYISVTFTIDVSGVTEACQIV